jgi:hypothetical protein
VITIKIMIPPVPAMIGAYFGTANTRTTHKRPIPSDTIKA